MKHLLYLTLALLMAHLVKAQNENPQMERIRRSFEPILTQQVPMGILADVTPGSGVFERHNGVYGDSVNDPIEVFDVLLNLRNAALNPSSLPSKDGMLSRIAEFKKANIIPISFVNCAYARLKPEAFMDGIVEMDETTEQFRYTADPAGYFELDTIMTFGVHGLIDNASTARFVFPSDLSYINLNGLQPLWVDFGDGQGYRIVEFDKVYTVTYGWPESDHREILVTLSNTNVPANPAIFKGITSRTFQVVYPMPELSLMSSQISVSSPCYHPDFTAAADARFYIRYGKNQSVSKQIKKPFILVEGFDVDLNPHDNKFGQVDWMTFISGMSFDERNKQTRENLKDLKVLSDRLYQESYDCIVVDFKNGADDLFKNGNALIRIIQWVNEHKVGDEGISIMGASMGGVLARYAVRTMEMEACGPCTKLYGTFDSPHQGANIPLAIQHAVKLLAPLSTEAEIAYNILKLEGAKQLLISNISDETGKSRNIWQGHLQQIGHPLTPKRIAITNGSPTGSNNDIDKAGDLMYSYQFDLEIVGYLGSNKKIQGRSWNFVPFISLQLFSQKGRKGTETSDVILKAETIRISTLDSLKSGSNSKTEEAMKTIVAEKISKANNIVILENAKLSYDNCAGGQAEYLSLINTALLNLPKQSIENNNVSLNTKTTIINRTGVNHFTTFVPTYSGLDLFEPQENPNLIQSYSSKGLKSYEPNPGMHPFHSIFFNSNPTETRNQSHVFIDARNGQSIDFIMNELRSVQIEIPKVIPTQNPHESSYNFNDPYTFPKAISKLTILENGSLYLNNAGYGKFGDGPKPSKTDLIMDFYTGGCISSIILKPNGQMIVGENNNELGKNNVANMHIMPGDLLELESNSSLTINKGSTLVVEEGAKLVFHENSRIKLFGELSELVIKGQIIVKEGANFTIEQLNESNAGSIKVVNTLSNGGRAIIPDGANCKISLKGQSPWKGKLLEIKNGPLLIKGFEKVEISNAEIKLEEESQLSIYDPCTIEYLYFQSINNESNTIGIETFGQNNQKVNLNKFEKITTAIKFEHNSSFPEVELKNNAFSSCKTAIYASTCIPTMTENRFEGCNSSVILNSVPSFKIIESVFEGNIYGVQSLNTIEGYHGEIKNSLFNKNIEALSLIGIGQVNLTCNRFFENNLAVFSEIELNMSRIHKIKGNSGGNNSFVMNQKGVVIDGGELYLEEGGNNFISSTKKQQYNFIEGDFRQYNSSIKDDGELSAGGNYWYPMPSNGALSQSGTNYFNLKRMAFPHPTTVYLKGYLLNTPDKTCFNPEDSDVPQESNSNKRNETNINIGSTSIYPNPFNEVLTVFVNLEIESDLTMSLYDMEGRKIVERIVHFAPSGKSVYYFDNLETLTSGLYRIRIETNTISRNITVFKN